jgi:succinate-semialdehyde dehydrogenase / glutarate-semialdehyde dehydrogenase
MYPDAAALINGKYRRGGDRRTMPIENPASNERIGTLTLANATDLDDALAAARAGFARWRSVSAWERGGILRKVAIRLREEAPRLARLLTLEQGKVLREAEAEVQAASEVFDWVSEEGKRAYGRVVPGRGRDRQLTVLREPIGPVAAFAPWNFPLVLPVRKVATALAAGCSVILKPSEETPGIALALAEICFEAGIPEDCLGVVFGNPPEVSEHLISSPVIRKASITGSIEAGRAVATLCGKYLKRCTLELGGHAAVGVFQDADVAIAAQKLTTAKFRNAGQVCVSPSRFYVHETLHDQFVERLVAHATALSVGDGLDPASTMGPLANRRQLQSIADGVADATAQGARVACGGERVGNSGNFFAPTVLTDVPDTARIMQVEPFGPVIPVARFSSQDEFVARANALSYGLASVIFSNDLRVVRRVSQELEVGMVGVNDTAFGLPETPVCGVKDSGYGHEGGTEGLAEYTVTKFINEVA